MKAPILEQRFNPKIIVKIIICLFQNGSQHNKAGWTYLHPLHGGTQPLFQLGQLTSEVSIVTHQLLMNLRKNISFTNLCYILDYAIYWSYHVQEMDYYTKTLDFITERWIFFVCCTYNYAQPLRCMSLQCSCNVK